MDIHRLHSSKAIISNKDFLFLRTLFRLWNAFLLFHRAFRIWCCISSFRLKNYQYNNKYHWNYFDFSLFNLFSKERYFKEGMNLLLPVLSFNARYFRTNFLHGYVLLNIQNCVLRMTALTKILQFVQLLAAKCCYYHKQPWQEFITTECELVHEKTNLP